MRTLLPRPLTLGLCLGVLFAAAAAQADRLRIDDVTVIDGTGGPPLRDASVLVEGERIAAVLRAGEPRPPADRRVDGAGGYLIPGLIDGHIHLRGGTEVGPMGLREVALDFDEAIAALHSYLYAGVTAVYDAGNVPEFIFELRSRERSGAIVAPRIFATGSIVTWPGSHGSGPGALLVDEWPGDREAVDAHIAARPDMVKFTLEERGWGARPMIPFLPPALLEQLVEYYNDAGIRTVVHVAGEFRARQAVFAGVDSLAHPVIIGPVSDRWVQLMAVKRIPFASTLTIGENYSRLADHPDFLEQPLYRHVLSEEERARLRGPVAADYRERRWTRWMELMTPVAQENIRQIHAAGGIVALGTDQTIGPAVHREMELLVAAGISPPDVIRIATLNAARYLGREEDLGSITVGKLADLVLLQADPTQDIGNARRIVAVFKGGQRIDREALSLPIPGD